MRILVGVAGLASLVLALACSSTSLVPCQDQAACDPLGAVCVDGYCRRPDDVPEADLAVEDMTILPDLAGTCSTSAECTAPRPVCLDSGFCGECKAEADCAATRQICDASSNKCVPCTARTDCASGICDDGKCAAVGAVVHVDNNQAPCTGADGTALLPFCEIDPAISTGKPYILVAGSATAYAPFKVPVDRAGFLGVFGPGKDANPKATIAAMSSEGALLAPEGGKSATLTIEGFDFAGNSADAMHDLIFADSAKGPATLIVRDCVVHQSGRFGIRANGNVTIDKTVSIANKTCAIMTTGGTATITRSSATASACGMAIDSAYTIENNLIAANHDVPGNGLGVGVTFNAGATGVFRFNTVVSNGSTGVAGAIVSLDPHTIESSIIVNNTLETSTATQLHGPLVLQDTVTGADPAGGTQLTPTFMNAGNWRLVATDPTNLTCCIDKIASGPAVDYDGTSRPKGAGWDIGAFEAQ